jgi:hypothetical protein
VSKPFLYAWPAAFVAWMAGSFLVHGHLLHADYAALPNLFRPEAEMQQHHPLMIAAHLIMAAAFVWIYSRGVEAGPWIPQGIRFGVAVALLGVVPTYMMFYVVQPMPGVMAVKQAIGDGALVVLIGVITASLYRRVPVA